MVGCKSSSSGGGVLPSIPASKGTKDTYIGDSSNSWASEELECKESIQRCLGDGGDDDGHACKIDAPGTTVMVIYETPPPSRSRLAALIQRTRDDLMMNPGCKDRLGTLQELEQQMSRYYGSVALRRRRMNVHHQQQQQQALPPLPMMMMSMDRYYDYDEEEESLLRKRRRLTLNESFSQCSSGASDQNLLMNMTMRKSDFCRQLLCMDSLHGESLLTFFDGKGDGDEGGNSLELCYRSVVSGSSCSEKRMVEDLHVCKEHVGSILRLMDDKAFPTDTHTVETALSICTHVSMLRNGEKNGAIFADESSMILFSAACFSVACKFCQSVAPGQMQLLKRWIVDAHIPLQSPSKYLCVPSKHLFNMEVWVLQCMDWRVGYSLHPTTSGLLFLTGLMHRMQEQSLAALCRLIVMTYTDMDAHEDETANMTTTRTLYLVRRHRPELVALACLSTTLLLAKDAIKNMPVETRTNLLLEVAAKLGMEDVREDKDFLVCPGKKEQMDCFVRVMEYISCLVYEMQGFVAEEDEVEGERASGA